MQPIAPSGQVDEPMTIKLGCGILHWEGSFGGFDVKAELVNSHGVLTDFAAGGYVDSAQFFSAIASGVFDPIAGVGSSNLATAVLHTPLNQTFSDVTTFSVGAQHPLFDLPGGSSILSVGAEYDRYKYRIDYSSLALSQRGYA